MADATFSLTKLVVADLDRASAFYQSVCGFTEGQRIDAVVFGRKMTEIIMETSAKGAAMFVLMAYEDAPQPATGETVLGFFTDDIDAFVNRASQAGGQVLQPPYAIADLGLKVAFVGDPEGHVVEVLQRI